MAAYYDIGLETGDMSEFDSDSGNATYGAHADAAKLGSYGLRVLGPGVGWGTVTITDVETWIGFHLFLDPALSLSQYGQFSIVKNDVAALAIRKWGPGAGFPDEWLMGTDSGVNTNLTGNTWHWIKIHLIPNGSGDGGWELLVDDEPIYSNLDEDTNPLGNNCHFGVLDENIPASQFLYIDNILISENEEDIVEPTAGGYTLEVDHILHGHILNELFLTQKNVLSVDDLLHKHLLDEPTITQAVNLVIESILHGHLLGEPVLTQAQQLAVDNILHGHLLDDISLTQAQLLSLDDILHGHKVDDVAVTVKTIVNLLVDSVLHGHSVDGLSLTQKMQLAVDDVFHGHTLDDINLGGAITLIVADILHSHIVGEPALTQAFNLFVDDITQAHLIDGVSLTQAQLLVVDDIGHQHSLGEINLSQKHILALKNLLHGHSVDDIAVNFVTAQGVMTVTFSALKMDITYTSKKADIDYIPKKMGITYEGQNG